MLEIDGAPADPEPRDHRLSRRHLSRAAAASRPMPADRAHVLALALAIACDIHPLNNLRVLKYLLERRSASAQEARDAGIAIGCGEGFDRAGGDGARRAPAASCSATRRPSPTSAWSRRCTMPAASTCRSTPIRPWSASTPRRLLDAFAAALRRRIRTLIAGGAEGGARMGRVDKINSGMAETSRRSSRSKSRRSRARSARRNGRSASISPPPTGWSHIMAGTISSSPISRRGFRGRSIISCSTPTISCSRR